MKTGTLTFKIRSAGSNMHTNISSVTARVTNLVCECLLNFIK